MRITTVGGGPGGLFASILIKKARPDADVEVLERNGPDDTFGWGVVFSDETLSGIRAADPECFDEIARRFAHWSDIDVYFRGSVIRSGGHGFAGISRKVLLNLLQARATALGVRLRFGSEVEDLEVARRGCDLLIAADGVNSRARALWTDAFKPSIAKGAARYIWLGTKRRLPAFTFVVRENEHGTWTVHAYQFDDQHSTFIIETDAATLERAGLEGQPDLGVAYCERLFADALGGERLLTNKSSWIAFPNIRCERWRHENAVLLGDAVHTAHFSIGSGTKLAMEDAIALARAVVEKPSIPEALEAYETQRQLDVAKTQRVAARSQAWFEEISRYVQLEPEQFAFSMLTRSYKVTHANLALRDRSYVSRVDAWFAAKAGVTVMSGRRPPPPMFTPLDLRGLHLENRVVVSPMCQYSCSDGTVTDWHVVHLGSRAIGGAGLVVAEMTDVLREGRISPGCAGMYLDEHVPAWRRVTEFIHQYSRARIGIQLAHAGRKGSTPIPWKGALAPEESWPLVAPSALAWDAGCPAPRAMSREDLDAVREAFVRATQMAERAGFDLVELHAAHGYLLSSFLSPLTNQRTDAYGGSLANRMRYPLEVFEAVRAAWPAEKPMSVRFSATDWQAGGFGPEDAVAFACALKALHCDVVDISSGGATPDAHPDIYGRMYQVPFSDRVRLEAGIPTIAVGNVTEWDQVNTILAAGRADLVMLARQHLRDPYFALHAAADQQVTVPWPDPYRSVAARFEDA